MKLSILLFAGLSEAFETDNITIELEDHSITAGQMMIQLCDRYPHHAEKINRCFLAKNRKYALSDEPIQEGDELALIPPVSGGQSSPLEPGMTSMNEPLYVITDKPLDAQAVLAKVLNSNNGASLVFVGTTREMTGQFRTVRLEYVAYIPMALDTLRQIGEEITDKWPDTICAITHRIGVVDIGEASVVIAVSSPHRAACYEASRHAIERIKQIVPIWKKEYGDDGEEWKGHQDGTWNPV